MQVMPYRNIRISPGEFQRSIPSSFIVSGHSLCCQSPHRELIHLKTHPGVESSATPTRWSGELQRALCQDGKKESKGWNYNFHQQPLLSSIWATSKSTPSIPKRIFCAIDKPPFYHSAPELHGVHVWKSMPYCAIQTDFKVRKLNILLQFDIKALVIKHITIPLVF